MMAQPLSTGGGLGLTDIDGNVKGLILIGRRSAIVPETSPCRRQLVQDLNIDIHSLDDLLQSLEGCLVSLKKPPDQGMSE